MTSNVHCTYILKYARSNTDTKMLIHKLYKLRKNDLSCIVMKGRWNTLLARDMKVS